MFRQGIEMTTAQESMSSLPGRFCFATILDLKSGQPLAAAA